MFIIVKDDIEGLRIVEILNTNLYKFLINVLNWSNHKNDISVINFIKYPIFNNIYIINNSSIYKYFNLNDEEIKFIEQNL